MYEIQDAEQCELEIPQRCVSSSIYDQGKQFANTDDGKGKNGEELYLVIMENRCDEMPSNSQQLSAVIQEQTSNQM